MAWGSKGTTSALTLGSSYSTVQESAADKEFTLNPGELLQIIFDVDFQATPTENADIIVQKTVDGTEYESDGEADRYIIEAANRETDDPAERSISITGVYGCRIRARVRDTDDTAGGTDTSTTLTCHYRLDGVSL